LVGLGQRIVFFARAADATVLSYGWEFKDSPGDGCARYATEAQYQQATRKLARKYHPDDRARKRTPKPRSRRSASLRSPHSPEKTGLGVRDWGRGLGRAKFSPAPDWGAGIECSGAGALDSDYSDFFEALFRARARAGADNGAGGFHPGRVKITMRSAARSSMAHAALGTALILRVP